MKDMSSYSRAPWRKVIFFTAFISLVFLVLFFVWLKSEAWNGVEISDSDQDKGVSVIDNDRIIDNEEDLLILNSELDFLRKKFLNYSPRLSWSPIHE